MSDLISSTSSEERQITESRIDKIPKFICNERVFFNDQTYTYIYGRSDCKISLPEIPNDNPIISSLLFIRKLVLRIGVLYKYKAMTTMMFGSGVLITNKLVLTSGHIFDPIDWNAEKVSYSNIFIAFSDPAPETAFSLLNPDKSIFAAKVIRRGLLQDKINDHTQYDNNLTDLALLALDNAAEITTAEYFQPTLNQKSSTTLNVPLNSKLYLIGYNGELLTNDELKPYRHLHEFANLNIDKLNLYHHINYKSISIGKLLREGCDNDQYFLHNCSTLPGSSGSIILNHHGNLAGIHVGVSDSRQGKEKDIFYNKETYNKYVSIESNQFKMFIRETILPNVENEELYKEWLFNSQ